MAHTPDVDGLLRLVEKGFDPRQGAVGRAAPNLDAEGLVRLLGESQADPTGDKAAAAFAAEGELAASAKRRLKKLFEKLDADGSGCVDLQEFRKLLLQCDTSMLGLPTCQLADVFEAADSNGDDEVDYNEFLAWLGLGKRTAPSAEPVPMPELEFRFGGPTEHSAGEVCWKQYKRLMVQHLARALGTWRPPDGFEAKMELQLGKAEKLSTRLGAIEDELRARRMRAQGAMRRWVADNFSLTSKAYMKKVEEIERRDVKVRSDRSRLQTDSEAREAAQLAGWTCNQQLGQLSLEHKQLLEELSSVQQTTEQIVEPAMKDLTAWLPSELFPSGLDQAPLRAEEIVPGCRFCTSLDAINVPGEDVVLCVDMRVVDERRPVRSQPVTNRPVDFVFVLDQSASMIEETPLIGRAIEALALQMGTADRLSVVGMGDKARLLLDWTEMTPSGQREARACAGKLTAQGGSSFFPACEMMLLQLRAAQASHAPGRQAAALFLSDGRPLEARDAVFSFFSRRLAAFPSLLFAPVALGPEADASLMAELGRCTQGPALYLPDESAVDEVLGQVRAMAAGTALLGCRVLLRPAQGCALCETEEPSATCGAEEMRQEISVSPEKVRDVFRCVVVLSSESLAFKTCKFVGGEGQSIYLSEPLYAGAPGVETKALRGRGRPLVTTSQRLICIRREKFLPKSKRLRELEPLNFFAEEYAKDVQKRPPNRILSTGISKGTVELEFEPTWWAKEHWVLAEDLVTDEATLFSGGRLVGYKNGESGEMQSSDLDFRTATDEEFAVWQMLVLERLVRNFGRHLMLCFDNSYPCTLVQAGALHWGSSRQVCVRLRVPKSAQPQHSQPPEDPSRALLDVLVLAVAVEPDGTSRTLRQRLGLTLAQVPSLSGRHAVLRFGLTGEQPELDTVTRALAESSGIDAGELQLECEAEGSILVGPRLSSPLLSNARSAATLQSLIAGVERLELRGFTLSLAPSVVGLTALRRLAQWRLACCLRAAVETGSWACAEELRRLCGGALAKALESAGVERSPLRAAVLEVAAAEAAVRRTQLVDSGHRILGLAAVHGGQHPPGCALAAAELTETASAWEPMAAPAVLRAVRAAASAALPREHVPNRVDDATFAGANGAEVSVRFCAVGGNGAAVTAYVLIARDCETGEVYQQSSRAEGSFAEGRTYTCSIGGLPSGKPFSVVICAWNGRRGPPSAPLWCSTPKHALHSRGPGVRSTARVSA